MPLPPTRLAILSAFSVSAISAPGLAPCAGYSATPASTSKSPGSLARSARGPARPRGRRLRSPRRQDDADLVVPEAGADGAFGRGFLHGLREPAQDLPGALDLARRHGLREVGDVEDRHGEPLVRGDGLRQEQPVELVPVRQPGHEVGRRGPAEGLLHLPPHDRLEGFEARLRDPVRRLHQLREEARDFAAGDPGEVHALLHRAPDAPPQYGVILYDPDRVPPQLVLGLGDPCDQSAGSPALAEGVNGLRARRNATKAATSSSIPATIRARASSSNPPMVSCQQPSMPVRSSLMQSEILCEPSMSSSITAPGVTAPENRAPVRATRTPACNFFARDMRIQISQRQQEVNAYTERSGPESLES